MAKVTTEHECNHEVDFIRIQMGVESMNAKIQDIHIAVLGKEGKGGLVTNTELNRSAINRLWWAIGSVFTGIVGLAFYIIKGGIKP